MLSMIAGPLRTSIVAVGIAATGNLLGSVPRAIKAGLLRFGLVQSNSVSSFGRVDKIASMAEKVVARRTRDHARSGADEPCLDGSALTAVIAELT